MRWQAVRGARQFTLLEILVAVAMLVILAGLLAGTLFKSKEKARRDAQVAQNVKILTAIEKFKEDFGIYPFEGFENGATFVRDFRRQIPNLINRQNSADTANLATGDTLTKCLMWSAVSNDDDADQEVCVGNYLVKGEANLSADGKILDGYGSPLIYWLRYKESDVEDYPPISTAGNDETLTPEIWSAGADKEIGS